MKISTSIFGFNKVDNSFDTFEERKKRIESLQRRSYRSKKPEKIFYLASQCEHFAFCSKGDERKFFIKQAVTHYKFNLETHSCFKSSIFLSMLLVKEKSVRNLDQAMVIFEFLKQNNEFPHYLEPTEQKAIRMSGKVPKVVKFDLSKKTITPAILKELRKDFRYAIRLHKKQKNINLLKQVLNEYYKFGVFFVGIFGKSDGYVGGFLCEIAEIMKNKTKDLSNFSYKNYGKILHCNFISDKDWKVFENTFGKTTKTFDSMSYYKDMYEQSFKELKEKAAHDHWMIFNEKENLRQANCARSGKWNQKARVESYRKRMKNDLAS